MSLPPQALGSHIYLLEDIIFYFLQEVTPHCPLQALISNRVAKPSAEGLPINILWGVFSIKSYIIIDREHNALIPSEHFVQSPPQGIHTLWRI